MMQQAKQNQYKQQQLRRHEFENPLLQRVPEQNGKGFHYVQRNFGTSLTDDEFPFPETNSAPSPLHGDVEYIKYADTRESNRNKLLLALVAMLVFTAVTLAVVLPYTMGACCKGMQQERFEHLQKMQKEAMAAIEAKAEEAKRNLRGNGSDSYSLNVKVVNVNEPKQVAESPMSKFWGYRQTQQIGKYVSYSYNEFTSIPFETKKQLLDHKDENGKVRDGCCEENGTCGAPDACCRFCWYNGKCCCSNGEQCSLWMQGPLTQQLMNYNDKGCCHNSCCAGCGHAWWISLSSFMGFMGSVFLCVDSECCTKGVSCAACESSNHSSNHSKSFRMETPVGDYNYSYSFSLL